MEKLTFKQKLLKVQEEIEAIKKDAENPYFKSKYFDINSLLKQVKPVLNKYGLFITQGLSEINGRLALDTEVADSESEDTLSNKCPLPEITDPQKAGSAITYFRRYAIQSLLALEAEDDDAEGATEHQKSKKDGATSIIKPSKGGIDTKGEAPF